MDWTTDEVDKTSRMGGKGEQALNQVAKKRGDH